MINFTLPKNINNRSVYIDKVRPFLNSNIIKVFTGQRRVGKSYLLYQIIQEILKYNETATILYINKEELAFSDITVQKIKESKPKHDIDQGEESQSPTKNGFISIII